MQSKPSVPFRDGGVFDSRTRVRPDVLAGPAPTSNVRNKFNIPPFPAVLRIVIELMDYWLTHPVPFFCRSSFCRRHHGSEFREGACAGGQHVQGLLKLRDQAKQPATVEATALVDRLGEMGLRKSTMAA